MSKKEPSLDEYTKLKDELVSSILKKREIDAKLAQLEEEIYDKELDYFNESTYGNIVKGFESFGKMSLGGLNKRKMVFNDEDHIFSMSSATFIKALMRKQGVNSSSGELDDYEDSVEPGNGTGNGNTSGKESASSTPLRKRK
ncbi:hypothetical protein PUMCH_001156 [Australozyma saopauloensis]|uniref:Chromatin modification-related protein EAF6 n=1 Tax=Australozyma saopauloensis TaxID=291208 RepID=A0AAX4H5P8_9ASCO|nr:hypothetical protein PUMCH_001156 [[Candida] saopauloensis]